MPAGGGGASATRGPKCGTEATRKRLDLYLMVDNNVTLPDPIFSWAGLVQGAIRYVSDPRAAGTGVGVNYFSIDCTEDFYARPIVPVDLLPGNQAALTGSLRFSLISGALNTSPMLPALGGAIRYASSLSSSFDQKAAVVLVSDGFSSFAGCPSDPAAVAQKASDGLHASPSIETYVIAADTPNWPTAAQAGRFQPLDDIARVGGSGSARHVDVGAEARIPANADSAFADTLVQIQHEAEPCEYTVPSSVQASPDSVPLILDDAGTLSPALVRVDTATACTDAAYYLAPNPSASTAWAILCPATCSRVKAQGSSVWWMTSCAQN